MEEYVWYLVELFISGEASVTDIDELQYLLSRDPEVYETVKEFLASYKDPDPQITEQDKYLFYQKVEELRIINFKKQQTYILKKRYNGAGLRHRQSSLPIQQKANERLSGLMKELMMVKEFFKITVRNLQRNKGISFINITGLAAGIASAILIFLWIQNQLSYDQFHKNKDRVYQVYNRSMVNGRMEAWARTPIVLAPALQTEYPQVEKTVRANWVGAFVLKTKEKKLLSQGLFTDPGFFDLFSFPFIKGNKTTALANAHSIILTEKLAHKLFGDVDPVGKAIKLDSTGNFMVTGVLKDLPNNTEFSFEYLVPWSYMKEVGWDNTNWNNYAVRTFVLLKKGVTQQNADAAIRNIYRSHNGDKRNEVFLHPMTKWWLYSKFENGHFTGGRIETVRLFGIIAVLIILIACINYMNLGTARSARRAKEVGIRKVSGAGKSSLIKQFLGESVIIAFIAGIIGLVMVELSLPWFNLLIGSQLFIPVGNIYFWLTGIGFLLFTGIIAGSYPAFYLSAYKPINVLKGTFKGINTMITPRKVLVVVQFTFAITFIIATTVIYRQIKYTQDRDSGYDKSGRVFVYMQGDIQKKYQLIKGDLLASDAISSITRTDSPINDIWTSNDTYQWEGKDPNLRQEFVQFITDQHLTKTTGLKLIAGRDIDINAYPTDTAALLLNESAVKAMGFKNPLGQTVKGWQGNLHVVGVVKDFVAGWPYQLSMPAIIRGANKLFGTVTLKLNTNHPLANNIQKIASVFNKYNPDYPFDYKFVDESDKLKFRDDWYTGILAAVFASLTILISCMGLFALAACMAETRIKEIGIRKVLGASVARITALLSKEFLVLVAISFTIASPVAWWLMSSWLQNFPYHIHIGWFMFVLVGLISIIIALSTVSYQSIKAAMANPVKSLKTE